MTTCHATDYSLRNARFTHRQTGREVVVYFECGGRISYGFVTGRARGREMAREAFDATYQRKPTED